MGGLKFDLEIPHQEGGFWLKSPKKCIITGNQFYSTQFAIYGDLSNGVLSDVTISNNVVRNRGMTMRTCERVKITGNSFYGAGISLANESTYSALNCIVSENTFYSVSSSSYAIFAYNNNGCLFIGNTVDGFSTFIRLLNNSKYCNISNNICRNVSTFKNIGSVAESLKATIQDINNISYSDT